MTTEVNKRTESYENWQLILASVVGTYALMKVFYFVNDLDHGIVHYLKGKVFKLAKKFPFLNRKLMEELDKTRKGLEEDIIKANKGNLYIQELPETGYDQKKLFETIERYLNMTNAEWKSGALSGCVYGADDNLTALTTKVYEKFAWSNPMHADVFPDVRKMEAEVVRWVCNLFNGDDETCGTVINFNLIKMFKKVKLFLNFFETFVFKMTTGGTESIMLACKAYRDMALARGVKKPEMYVLL
jgi:sphinganine-1-phosphate aldolase